MQVLTEMLKELVAKNNNFHHFTNSIENYFNIMKSRLYKLDGLTHTDLMVNIKKVIKEIPKKSMKILLKEHINAQKKYVKKISNRIHKLKEYL
jgi:L-lysine 2,3-aminomutase